MLFSLITLTVASIQAAEIHLTWDEPMTDSEGSPLTNVAGYKVHYGQSSRDYDFARDVGNVLSIILDDLEEAQTYYITVTAYDGAGVESNFSNEVSILAGSTFPKPEGLVAAYSFDQGNGTTVADASGNGNDGLISGALWTSSG
jgi:hypothetical protein